MWIFNRICYYLLKRIGYLNTFSFIYFRKIILFSSILTWWPGVALWSANALRIGSYESLKRIGSKERLARESNMTAGEMHVWETAARARRPSPCCEDPMQTMSVSQSSWNEEDTGFIRDRSVLSTRYGFI